MKIKAYFEGLAVLMVVAWVGGMWVTGYLVAPILFHTLPDRTLAGMLAGKLFEATAYMGFVCSVYLVLNESIKHGLKVVKQSEFWIIVLMLFILLLSQYGIQPVLVDLKQQALPQYVMESAYASQFKIWHGISSSMYLVESLLGAWLLLKMYGHKN